MLADIRRPGQAHRAGDLRGYVREDIAVQVRHHHHVERRRRVGQLGGADVDDPVLIRNFRILGRDLIEDLVEETVGHLHDVVFGEAGDLLAPMLPRQLERIAHDLLRPRP